MNIQHLLKQAQQMQNQIGKVEKEIEATEYTATARRRRCEKSR